jgi:hypothetical protein
VSLHVKVIHIFQNVGEVWEQLTDFRIEVDIFSKALAFEQLAILVKSIGRLFYGQLKLDPAWDSLREDPRFYKLLAELAPSFSTISEIDRLIHVLRIRRPALNRAGASVCSRAPQFTSL